MFVVVVVFHLHPGTTTTFLPLMYENAAASLREEEGCHQFDVATDPERPDEVFLYELYSDEGAFANHLKASHFLQFNAATIDMIAGKTVTTYRNVVQ